MTPEERLEHNRKAYEKRLERNREWRKNNKEKLKEYYQKRQTSPERKEYDRIRSYQRRYGITREIFLEMRERQNRCCAICGRHEDEKLSRWGTLCIDHDHKTGQVRKLLCAQCNKGLGSFRDSPELLEKAMEYIKEFTYEKHTGVAAK